MSGKSFLDTNILIYAYDRDAGQKREQAAELISALWKQRSGILSTQVLQEFYVNVTRKIPTPLSPAKARDIVRKYLTWPIIENNGASVLTASEIQERFLLSFWDALILAAAREGGAQELISEDFNHGQIILGLTIRNPFLDQ